MLLSVTNCLAVNEMVFENMIFLRLFFNSFFLIQYCVMHLCFIIKQFVNGNIFIQKRDCSKVATLLTVRQLKYEKTLFSIKGMEEMGNFGIKRQQFWNQKTAILVSKDSNFDIEREKFLYHYIIFKCKVKNSFFINTLLKKK